MEFLQYDEMDVEETTNLVCEMCSEGQRLYKCPRCSLFTCSLKCCNDHKVKVNHMLDYSLYKSNLLINLFICSIYSYLVMVLEIVHLLFHAEVSQKII